MTLTATEPTTQADATVAAAPADWTIEPIAEAPNRLVLAVLVGVPAGVVAVAGLIAIWRYA